MDTCQGGRYIDQAHAQRMAASQDAAWPFVAPLRAVHDGVQRGLRDEIASGDVDERDEQGRTPLMHAVSNDRPDLAIALVNEGYDPMAVTNDLRSVADFCKAPNGRMGRWINGFVQPSEVAPKETSSWRHSSAASQDAHSTKRRHETPDAREAEARRLRGRARISRQHTRS